MGTLDKRDRQLAQLYLVNDVLQKSGLQGLPLFAQEVKPYLTPVFQNLQTASDQKFLSQLNNLIKVWRQRHLFDDSYLDQLTSQTPEQSLPDQIIPIPKELISYALNVQDLAKWKAKCQEQLEKVTVLLSS